MPGGLGQPPCLLSPALCESHVKAGSTAGCLMACPGVCPPDGVTAWCVAIPPPLSCALVNALLQTAGCHTTRAGFADTWAALDRRLEDALRLGAAAEEAGSLAGAAEGMASLLAAGLGSVFRRPPPL